VTLYMGQWAVPTGTIATFSLPPGPYNATFYNISTVATVYAALGTSPTVAPPLNANNGLVMHSIPTSWYGYQGERGGTIWILNPSASTTAAVNYVISVQQ
jgi:hypothetical protein